MKSWDTGWCVYEGLDGGGAEGIRRDNQNPSVLTPTGSPPPHWGHSRRREGWRGVGRVDGDQRCGLRFCVLLMEWGEESRWEDQGGERTRIGLRQHGEARWREWTRGLKASTGRCFSPPTDRETKCACFLTTVSIPGRRLLGYLSEKLILKGKLQPWAAHHYVYGHFLTHITV